MANEYEFIVGEIMRLKSGVFQSFTGRVVSIDEEGRTLKVIVSILGKWRTVEVCFSKVEKVT